MVSVAPLKPTDRQYVSNLLFSPLSSCCLLSFHLGPLSLGGMGGERKKARKEGEQGHATLTNHLRA